MDGWQAIKESLDEFKRDIKQDFKSLKKDNQEMRDAHASMGADIKLIKHDVAETKEKTKAQDTRLVKLEDEAKLRRKIGALTKFLLPTVLSIAGLVFTYLRFFS